MALAIDAKATATTHTAGATSLTNTTMTVGAGATSLLVVIAFQTITNFPTIAAGGVRWDSTGTNQSMTVISDNSSSGTNGNVRFFGLVNPTPGSGKTLSATWTLSAPAVLTAISFTGGVTTSVATAFVRTGTASDPGAGTTTPAVTLTGASGNISVCVYDSVNATSTGLTATSSTAWFIDSTEPNLSVRGATAPSASSVTWTGAPGTTEWVIAGWDVVAAPVAFLPLFPRPLLQIWDH